MSTPEISKHDLIKAAIFAACNDLGIPATQEYKGKDWRADVYVVNDSKKFAFEVQMTPQSLNRTLERQAKYIRDEVFGCWLFEKPLPKLSNERPDLPLFYVKELEDNSLFVSLSDRKDLPLRDFLQQLLTGNIKFCDVALTAHEQKIKIVFYGMGCWKCKEMNHIYYVEPIFRSACNAKIHAIETLWGSDRNVHRPEIISLVREFIETPEGKYLKLGEIKQRPSKTVERSYMSFGCYKCDSIFGEWFVRDAELEVMYGDGVVATIERSIKLGENIEYPIPHWCYPSELPFCDAHLAENEKRYGKGENPLNRKLNDAAKELLGIKPHSKKEMALLGHALGAIYSLRKSIEFQYSDRTGKAMPLNYSDELGLISKELSENIEVTSNDWISGYYFNSALYRLASLNERAAKYVNGNAKNIVPGVRDEVNKLKHRIDSVLSGREVNAESSIDACFELCKFIKKNTQATLLYFSYGSNMSTLRLLDRVPSAKAVSIARLERHRLRFHKKSKDGSGKCDIEKTDNPNDSAYGVVFTILKSEKMALDTKEGLGSGYNEKCVSIIAENGTELSAVTYYATDIDSSLNPYHWYKEHVLRGAKEHNLPLEYIKTIEAIESIEDPNQARHEKELSIYN